MINQDNNIEFLLKEYSELFTHMRHHDNLTASVVKFAFGFDLAVLSAGVTIYSYFKENRVLVVEPVGYLLLLAFLVGILFLALSLRNRVYFVRAARQVNRIRGYFKENMEIDFDFGDFYTNPDQR